MSINDRVKKRPLVVEDERLNFLDEKENEADGKEAEDGCKIRKQERNKNWNLTRQHKMRLN